MARLLIHVEGQTEEDFVNEVLRDHLVNLGYESVGARIVGNNRLRRRRGGIRPWPSVRKDITNHLRHDGACIATTMVDFYGLPEEGEGAWPGRKGTAGQQTPLKALRVEKALLEDIAKTMGADFNPVRFIPFVMMHEFEGLLFSDCAAFGRAIGQPNLESAFRQIRREFGTPEDINDSPSTAPSKRVENIVPGYEKPLFGILAILGIGLRTIRAECPHFAEWLTRLEALVPLQHELG